VVLGDEDTEEFLKRLLYRVFPEIAARRMARSRSPSYNQAPSAFTYAE
jgi:hypothetical protein